MLFVCFLLFHSTELLDTFGQPAGAAGLVSLERFDARHALPAHLAAVRSLQDLLHDSGSLSAVNRAVEGLPCSLLPDGR